METCSCPLADPDGRDVDNAPILPNQIHMYMRYIDVIPEGKTIGDW